MAHIPGPTKGKTRPGIHKSGGGKEVVENQNGHKFSKHPQTKAKAHAQLRAIEAHIHGKG